LGFTSPTLRLSAEQHRTIITHCLDGLPDEACGLLAGPLGDDGQPTGEIGAVYPCRNADESARTYTVDGRDYLRADRDAQASGYEIVGVWHSHTHTDAYPSATDVKKAVDPGWIYAIASLKGGEPALRAYRITDGQTQEVRVEVGDGA
jgi:proteasome lid subunit RPN8/RPN11